MSWSKMIVIIIFSRMHFKRILPLWEIQWRIEEEEEHFTTVEKKQIFKSKSTVFNDFTKPDKSVLKTQSKIYDGTYLGKS